MVPVPFIEKAFAGLKSTSKPRQRRGLRAELALFRYLDQNPPWTILSFREKIFATEIDLLAAYQPTAGAHREGSAGLRQRLQQWQADNPSSILYAFEVKSLQRGDYQDKKVTQKQKQRQQQVVERFYSEFGLELRLILCLRYPHAFYFSEMDFW